MKKVKNKSFTLYYKSKYKKEKDIIINNYVDICNVIHKLWNVKPIKELDIFLLKSDLKFIFYTFPLLPKILTFTLLLPYWLIVQSKKWKKKRVIYNYKKAVPSLLIKPIDFLRKYKKLDTESIQNIKIEKVFIGLLCYVITLVFLYDLNLNTWIKDGMARVTEENFVEYKRLNNSTLNLLKHKRENEREIETKFKNKKYLLAKGYWTTKYLEEKYPGYLKSIISKNRDVEIDWVIGKKLGIMSKKKSKLWIEMDNIIFDYYKYKLN